MNRLTPRDILRIYRECRDSDGGLPDFAREIERLTLLRAAELCEEQVLRPAGYGGQWEGYGSHMGIKTGTECAAELRELAT